MAASTQGVPGIAAEWVTLILMTLVNFGVLFLILLLMREVVTWYFKINVLVKEQQETNRLLAELVEQGKSPKAARPWLADARDASDGDEPPVIM